MGLFDILTGQIPAQEPKESVSLGQLRLDDFWVAGVYYHKDAISRISTENPSFRKPQQDLRKIRGDSFVLYRFKYKTEPVVLVLEPGNKKDKNAVKVYIHDQHVGYVPQERSKDIHDILSVGKIEAIEAKIEGGDYRILFNDGTEQRQSENVKIHILLAYRKP